MVGLLEPFVKLNAGGLKGLLLCQVLLLQNLSSDVPRIRGGMLKPLPHERDKDIRSEILRAKVRDVLQHSLKITHDPSVSRMVNNVESDVELLPKGHRTPKPFA